MSFFDSIFGRGNVVTGSADCMLPEIYPLSLLPDSFMKSDVMGTYKKILTDVLERTSPISEKIQLVLWDNCVQSEATQGLVTHLSMAMYEMKDLFLVYNKAVNVLRVATNDEAKKIREDYLKSGESSTGVYISFKKYQRTEMLKIYSALEYSIMASLHKSLGLAKAVQVKINDLRGSVALTDSEVARAQARSMAFALSKGNDIIMDAKDEIVTATIDTQPTEKAILFLDAKKAFVLGLPMSYISGEQTTGIGSTGEADMRAIERGLKQYYVSIIDPVLTALFKVDTKFKSQDFRQMSSAIEVLKTFELVSNELLSVDSKRELLARMFDLDPKEELKLIEAQPEEPKVVEVQPKPNGKVNQVSPQNIR